MALEVELKFFCSEFDHIRKRLVSNGAKYISSYFERNLVFDTKDRTLKERQILLRLRQEGDTYILCLKKNPEKENVKDVKTWEEYQTAVDSPDQLSSILFGLGYGIAFSYEKIREKWSCFNCLICLDKLPFGKFVEIEGDRERIFDCAPKLGLDMASCTTKTYHQLNQEYRRDKGLGVEESFIFKA